MKNSSKKFHIISLGCSKNLIDSEKIFYQFEKFSFSYTPDPSSADVVVINTCGFIRDAVEESIDTILEMGEIKKKKPGMKIVVSGCMVQRYRDQLLSELPEVDLFVGTTDFYRIPELLDENKRLHITRPIYKAWEIPRHLLTRPPVGYLKIAEGCSANCSFCIIPRLRGPQRSRTVDKLLDEAKWMKDQGVEELIIIAQDTTAYGRDLDDETNLTTLLERLKKIEGFRWIRVQYLYPEEYDEEFIELFAEPPLLPYFDIPIQHFSDTILKRMNRRSDSKTIRNLFKKIKKKIPQSVIRTTVITGFPSETDDDFERLTSFLEEDLVDFFGFFKFSPEEEARASKFPDQIDEEIKEERAEILSQLAWEKLENFYNKFSGKSVSAIVEEEWDEKYNIGRAWFQGPDADGSLLIKKTTTPPPFFTEVEVKNEVSEFDGEVMDTTYLSTGTK